MSMNHIMFGEIGAWMYKGLAGIFPDAAQPGFRHILLRPHFVKGLPAFEATHEGPYGTIRSAWKTEGRVIVYTALIPPNCTATLQLPGKAGQPVQEIQLSAGEHSFRL
jgi:alpha-L-rhamnosidase